MKFLSLLLLFLCVHGMSSAAENIELSGYVGSHKLSFKAQSIYQSVTYTVQSPMNYLAITEIYPDKTGDVVYSYRVAAPGIGSYERSHKSRGFGPVTYFIRVRSNSPGLVKITNHSVGPKGRPILIGAVWGVTDAELKSLLDWDRFTVMGVIPAGEPGVRDGLMERLAKNLGTRPQDHIAAGFTSEIYYSNREKANVKEQIATCAKWANQYRMPAMLGMVSWWGGTPGKEPDGAAAAFGDIKYQQICYSPDTEIADNPELKALLGDRYNRHYGLSVPNEWHDCPWLTMNSPALNEYKFRRLTEALGLLSDVSGKSITWLKSVFLENEPRYWDTDCEAGNPKSIRKVLWADFNPLVIADAKKDGVELDPSDGLSDEELAWLHRNVGRYNQETVDALKKAMAARKFGAKLPIYTHSLQHQHMFPGDRINHSAAEWAYADGARTGIEGFMSQPEDFSRVREWGPWANLNREENDGHSIDTHLWDLRVAYMMGGDLYNSYNWHAIGAERFFGYVKEFLTAFPVVSLPPDSVRITGKDSLKLTAPLKLQAFTRIEIPVKVAKKVKGCAMLCVAFEDGQTFSSEYQPVDLAVGRRTLAVDFATPAQCPEGKEALVVLYMFDSTGHMALNSVVLTPESPKGVKLSLDLRTQRALSLAVIARAKR